MLRGALVGFLTLLLAACSAVPKSDLTPIEQHLMAAEQADIIDAEFALLEGYPHLRVNRLLVDLATQIGPDEPEKLADWTTHARYLAHQAERTEALVLGRSAPEVGERPVLLEAIRSARVNSPYKELNRFLGQYPLTAIGAHIGYEAWKRENLASFNQPVTALPVQGELTTYGLSSELSKAQAASLLQQSRQDAFGLYWPSETALMQIAAAYAPMFVVDVASDDDRVGALAWQSAERLGVNANEPTIYVRFAHTRWQGEYVPQLVYTIWFNARPKTSAFDILGGSLDGLVWRITLDRQGNILVHDTIHACGCYHLFFPTERVQRLPQPEDKDARETIETPAQAPLISAANQRLAVHVAATSHYVRGLSVVDGTQASFTQLAIQEERALTQLTVPGGGVRSAYDSDGLISQSARLERFLLWPLGVESAGAMRQWGHHATAFVGKRLFDDPRLIERAFSGS